MSPSPHEPNDADEFLFEFGEALVCAAVPSVTRGLLDDDVSEDVFADRRSTTQITILKVKRGAFGAVNVLNTLVTVTSRAQTYKIEGPLPHRSSLFDWYVLQPTKARGVT